MDDSLTRKSYVISCKYFPAPHNHQTITEAIQLLYSKFGINPSSITATVTDNGKNFVKAFNEYGRNNLEFMNFLEAEESEIQPIPFEEEDRAKIFDILNTVRCENNDTNNDDDDDECETLLELLHDNNVEDTEQQECEMGSQNRSEKLLNFCQSRVSSVELDDGTVLALSKHLRCKAHTLNLVGSRDSLRALRNKKFAKMYETVFDKLNMLWNCSAQQASSEIIIKHLGSNFKRPSNTRWNDTYLKVILIICKLEQHRIEKCTMNHFFIF